MLLDEEPEVLEELEPAVELVEEELSEPPEPDEEDELADAGVSLEELLERLSVR